MCLELIVGIAAATTTIRTTLAVQDSHWYLCERGDLKHAVVAALEFKANAHAVRPAARACLVAVQQFKRRQCIEQRAHGPAGGLIARIVRVRGISAAGGGWTMLGRRLCEMCEMVSGARISKKNCPLPRATQP
jgi:hypothetical protein